jgi:hypothetical protein
VQGPQCGARVDTQLAGQQGSGVLVDGERVGLASGAVQPGDQQFSQLLVQRVLVGQGGELGQRAIQLAEVQLRAQPCFLGGCAQSFQAGPLPAGKRPRQPGQRGAVPQLQPGDQLARPGRGVAGHAGTLGVGDVALEDGEVEPVVGQVELVAAGHGPDHRTGRGAIRQGLAQPRDIGADGTGRRAGHVLIP